MRRTCFRLPLERTGYAQEGMRTRRVICSLASQNVFLLATNERMAEGTLTGVHPVDWLNLRSGLCPNLSRGSYGDDRTCLPGFPLRSSGGAGSGVTWTNSPISL